MQALVSLGETQSCCTQSDFCSAGRHNRPLSCLLLGVEKADTPVAAKQGLLDATTHRRSLSLDP